MSAMKRSGYHHKACVGEKQPKYVDARGCMSEISTDATCGGYQLH